MIFTEVLTLVFVIYKLAGVVNWSWWLIFLPEICAMSFYIVVFVAIVMAHTPTKRKKRRK